MSGGKLPEGWGEIEIGDIADVISGGTPKSGIADNFVRSGEGIAWLTPADLSGYKRKLISHGARDLSTEGYSSCSAKLMPAGAILFSSRAPIGYVAVASNEISTNQGFKSFVFTNDIYPDYAYYYLRNIRHLAEEMGTGTTFKEISGSAAKTLPFVMAPLAEQKIIAEKLDTLLAQVASTKARLEQIPQLLKHFRQAVLAGATNGKLIENERQSFDQWTTKTLDYFFTCIDGDRGPNYPQKNDYFTEGHCLFLSTKNVRNFGFNFDETVFISKEKDKLLRKGKLARNDLIITTRGTLGNVASYDKTIPYDNVRINSGMLILRKKQEENCNEFLKILIASPIFQKEILRKKTGSAQPQLPANILKEFVLSIPPVKEQHEIVRRVEQLFAYADTVEKQVNNALARVNNLTQSILAKAFRGELTAQWRAENPDLISGENSAAAMLEKIKAERAASGSKKASRKKT